MTAEATSDDRLGRLGSLVRQRLRDDWTVERLAEAVGMSPRSFARHFTERFGTTPAQYVARIRLEAARAAMEQTRQPLGQIARRCGFGPAETRFATGRVGQECDSTGRCRCAPLFKKTKIRHTHMPHSLQRPTQTSVT